MSILPKNEPHKPAGTPRNFFIWGQTMSGKSYLAEHFPNVLVLNTDGNSAMGTRPSIQLRNVRNPDGSLKSSVIDQLKEVILELGTTQNTYETVTLDVIDDVCQLIEQAICLKAGVESLADMGYGRGYALFNTVLQSLVMDLKALPINVVYISRENDFTDDDGNTKTVPSLKTKYYNVVNGNCDLVIHTQHVGKNYLRNVTEIRRRYKASEINDSKILSILKAIPNALAPEVQTTKVGK